MNPRYALVNRKARIWMPVNTRSKLTLKYNMSRRYSNYRVQNYIKYPKLTSKLHKFCKLYNIIKI